MVKAAKAVLAVASALVAIAVLTAPAVAETLNFSPAERITWSGPLTWTDGLGARVTCNFIMRGTFERRITMTRGTNMGSLSSMATERCEGGSITTLPVPIPPIVYEAILRSGETLLGILVGISSLGILVESPLSSCLYSATLGVLTGVMEHLSTRTTLLRGEWAISRTLSGFCSVGTLAGTMELTPTQTVTIT